MNRTALSSKAFSKSLWLTRRQAEALGGQVRRYERPSKIIFTQPNDKKEFFVKAYDVFNVGQITGLPSAVIKNIRGEPKLDADEVIENYVAREGISVRMDYDYRLNAISSAALGLYNWGFDFIAMRNKPKLTKLKYKRVLLHEMVHSTGHLKRLNREENLDNGVEGNALEEMVAEFGAAYLNFLCGEKAYPAHLKHAEYIERFKNQINTDPDAVVKAIALAYKAVAFILSGKPKEKRQKKKRKK